MFTGAAWCTWRDARPGGARAREEAPDEPAAHTQSFGGKLQRGERLRNGGIGRCITAQIAPCAKTRHRSRIKRRLRGGEREELELSRMRGIRAAGGDVVQR